MFELIVMGSRSGDEMKWLDHVRTILRRACHARRGQSLVEFAMVAPLFFMLVFGITDFGRLFFTKLTLQHALREAGRYAVTGQKQKDPNNGNLLSRVQSIRNIAQQYAAGLLPNSSDVTVRAIDSKGNADTAHPAGLPGETVIVSLSAKLKLITPVIGQFFPQVNNQGEYDFTVSTSFKNEPFDVANAD
jgi:Flp pilus assembly protein TadG